MEGYPKTRRPKGFMHYASAACDFCSRRMIKRRWNGKYKSKWQKCPACDNSQVLFVSIGWDKYCNYMEDGALLVVENAV